jgi:hypothetical protein
MIRLMMDFLSKRWNLYGLQIIAALLIIVMLHQYLTMFQLCIIGMCVYLLSMCQRILGVRHGMIFSQLQRERVDFIVKEAKKRIKKNKEKRK